MTFPTHQPAMLLERLLPLLRDPVNKERLTAQRGVSGQATHIVSSHSTYEISGGIPRMLVNEDTLVDAFGARNVDAFLRLQQAAEASYTVRTEGHFSSASFGPAVDYGMLLARLERGLYLDVGCGLLAEPIYMRHARQLDFVGIDPMQIYVERRFPFAQAYGDFLPFGASCFDGVLYSSTLDHVFNPQQALEEGLRVLRPGGKLVIFTTIRPVDAAFERWQRRAVFFATPYNTHHHWGFTADLISDLLAEVGARIDVVEATRHPQVVVVIGEKPRTEGEGAIESCSDSTPHGADDSPIPERFL